MILPAECIKGLRVQQPHRVDLIQLLGGGVGAWCSMTCQSGQTKAEQGSTTHHYYLVWRCTPPACWLTADMPRDRAAHPAALTAPAVAASHPGYPYTGDRWSCNTVNMADTGAPHHHRTYCQRRLPDEQLLLCSHRQAVGEHCRMEGCHIEHILEVHIGEEQLAVPAATRHGHTAETQPRGSSASSAYPRVLPYTMVGLSQAANTLATSTPAEGVSSALRAHTLDCRHHQNQHHLPAVAAAHGRADAPDSPTSILESPSTDAEVAAAEPEH